MNVRSLPSKLALTTVLLCMLSSCQSNKVLVDYDTSTDFSKLRHYSWMTGGEENIKGDVDPLMDERTKAALTKELFRAKLDLADGENNADVLVRFSVKSETYNQESNSSSSVGFGRAGGSSAIGISLSIPLGGDAIVKETQIIIDLLGANDRKLKWRGSKTLKISDQSPAEITEMINAAVSEIFEFYPPGSETK